MPRTRPEQLGWDLSQNLAITASGNYFVIDDTTGNVYLNSGSLYGTASQAITASYALNVPDTSSYAVSASKAVSSSYALTASYALSFGLSNAYYLTQSIAVSSWVINHNLNTQLPLVQIYDLDHKAVIPKEIINLNSNQSIIVFDISQAGYAVVSRGDGAATLNIGTSSYALTASYLNPLNQNVVITGSLTVTSSNTFTNIGPAVFSGSSTFTEGGATGSFTGSFTGDGSGIINVPASSITGLNLNQIASGSTTASIAPDTGFTVNTDTNIQGSLTASSAIISGDVQVLGTASINTLVVNQTQLSTGSNQLGDAANDFQTLYGTVRIPTGSLTVTGSAIIAGTQVASSGTGRTMLITSSLSASANNDTLVGFDINPTFTNGAFTGVNNYAVRIKGGGSTYTTFPIYTINSSSVETFQVRDDGAVKIGAGSFGHPTLTRLQVNDMSGNRILRLDPTSIYVPGVITTIVGTDTLTLQHAYSSIIQNNNTVAASNRYGTIIRYSTTSNTTTTTTFALKAELNLNITDSSTGSGTFIGMLIDPVLGTLANNNYVALRTTVGNVQLNSTSGNTLIGTTTDSGYKLDVSGSGRFTSNVQITGSLILQPTSSATQTVAIIQAGSGSIALVPSGSGAIMASIPDGTTVGGNARGQYAVDLQLQRSNANEVAGSSNSFIGGGWNNKITGGSYGAIVSGRGNNLGSNAWYTFIGSGQNNSINGSSVDYSVIAGGNTNTISSQHSTISGGQSNTASTNTHATVVGGLSNVASGQYSTAGGQNNTASGNKSTVFGGPYSTASGDVSLSIGWANVASGNYSVALNSNNAASGVASIALGYESKAYLDYSQTLASTKISTQGDAQATTYVTRTSSALTSATTASLAIGGGYTPGIPNGNNRTWHTVVDTVAVVTAISGSATGVTVGDSFMQTDKLLFKRVGGTSSVVGRSTTETIYDTSMSTALMSFTAGSSQELAITFTAPIFTGGGSITCRVVSKVSLVEVAY